MEATNIVKMFNEEGLGLKEIGEKLGMSKSTVQRKIVAGGWQFNRKLGKYETIVQNETQNSESNVSRETLKQENNETVKQENNETNISCETVKQENNIECETGNIVNRTYGIPGDIDRALKIKCAIEGTKVIEIVRKALREAIEQKYFDMK